MNLHTMSLCDRGNTPCKRCRVDSEPYFSFLNGSARHFYVFIKSNFKRDEFIIFGYSSSKWRMNKEEWCLCQVNVLLDENRQLPYEI